MCTWVHCSPINAMQDCTCTTRTYHVWDFVTPYILHWTFVTTVYRDRFFLAMPRWWHEALESRFRYLHDLLWNWVFRRDNIKFSTFTNKVVQVRLSLKDITFAYISINKQSIDQDKCPNPTSESGPERTGRPVVCTFPCHCPALRQFSTPGWTRGQMRLKHAPSGSQWDTAADAVSKQFRSTTSKYSYPSSYE